MCIDIIKSESEDALDIIYYIFKCIITVAVIDKHGDTRSR